MALHGLEHIWPDNHKVTFPVPQLNTHTPNMTSNIAPLYHIAPLTAPGMDLIDGDGGIKVDISTMMVEERRTRRQCWFVCTIACNILLEVRKLILSNKTNNENEVTLKEFTLYVLYYAAATLGGVDTYADGRNPPHGFPYYTNTELAKYLDNLSIPLDKAEGIVVEPIIPMLTWKGLRALHYICGPFNIEDLPMVAKTESYYGLFQSYTHTDHHRLVIEMNLLDPKREAIIIEGMEEIHGKFHSGGWFDPVAIQIVPNAHSMTNVVIFIDWVDGKAERAAIEKIVSDTREEDRLWELECSRIIADTSLHTLVETWDPKTRDWDIPGGITCGSTRGSPVLCPAEKEKLKRIKDQERDERVGKSLEGRKRKRSGKDVGDSTSKKKKRAPKPKSASTVVESEDEGESREEKIILANRKWLSERGIEIVDETSLLASHMWSKYNGDPRDAPCNRCRYWVETRGCAT
ncbi:hypothetical protein M422DRAFT_254063 [Sphaerobolus stellatus SS14]|uniref:Uncharacterized protein n=1 Tax=Sphaerobolus stellatus (strain SS14) TaxID=990650 RepID=A0A0C9VVF4_SPHS4|nr:hypothetical protein M422DRAFT_254063 [Sphaerobolus stellatus SS14]